MKRSGPTGGILITGGFFLLIIVVAIVFTTLIFSEAEVAVNTTNLSADEYDDYNTTTGIVQTGLTVWEVVAILVVGGMLCGIALMLAKHAR